jgi:hypothetical protein
MFTLGGGILIIVSVLFLLHLLLLPSLPLVNGIGIACRADQPVFVYASTSMRMALSTELVLC